MVDTKSEETITAENQLRQMAELGKEQADNRQVSARFDETIRAEKDKFPRCGVHNDKYRESEYCISTPDKPYGLFGRLREELPEPPLSLAFNNSNKTVDDNLPIPNPASPKPEFNA